MSNGAYVSVLDMFSIGIGPSSSHTVGPMRAARAFVAELEASGVLTGVTHVRIALHGSLAATGIGHGTPGAVVAGLTGLDPSTCDPDEVRVAWPPAAEGSEVVLEGGPMVRIRPDDVEFAARTPDLAHPNTIVFTASSDAGVLAETTYLSVGGGFIRRLGDDEQKGNAALSAFSTAAELLALCANRGRSIGDIAREAERTARNDDELDAGIDAIVAAMTGCIRAGLSTGGVLPGGLDVPRRAPAFRARLEQADPGTPDLAVSWLHAYTLAVNEENAAGGRVVTAPTNGAAGIVPAVLQYYLDAHPADLVAGSREFLLTATAIGSLVKANASISGADGGCQAEVGSACAMAAAGLCAVLGGTPWQVENAAEIAIEHHLGLTCDPVGGLVQIPCIERNAVAASTAVTAARLALHGDGSHRVSLDIAIETMRQTGVDMSSKYKETSLGGLAVNVIEC
ncbi:L-serine ammonia-lyase [Microbacterium sp. JB110]|uniref:L-serine ammonia-lyase n=1 Tax=Microbacterium sp. JB110 TaxID=2024477 RepID=UPI00097F011F|nr:L-serine ammonia-lyase [Microbacterium sp. JB110]RCS60094.1 L-serine ammonia-lyase [Microbacterium sp. JB110]SJM45440.1 L-serine dehydratase [Frigoribacterium sp. JB110]